MMDRKPSRAGQADRRERSFGSGRGPGGSDQRRKPLPPEKTHAEEYYYLKQMNAKTPMVVVMADGEELRGWIEWYDQHCLKVHRNEGPNLLVFKRHIKYIVKDSAAESGA
ncbi:MAG: RNA chaperone Hfq [Acidobacteriota bacterium]|nr:RNA chaperone Hfq [Acidobacteriota bacterium]MDQ7088466.1 RNA chaperone Hfq [Acidobacteriota bacterium]